MLRLSPLKNCQWDYVTKSTTEWEWKPVLVPQHLQLLLSIIICWPLLYIDSVSIKSTVHFYFVYYLLRKYSLISSNSVLNLFWVSHYTTLNCLQVIVILFSNSHSSTLISCLSTWVVINIFLNRRIKKCSVFEELLP